MATLETAKQDDGTYTILAANLTAKEANEIAALLHLSPASVSESAMEECIDLFMCGSKLAAVKLFKEYTRLGLKDSKEGIESVIAAMSGFTDFEEQRDWMKNADHNQIMSDWKKLVLVGFDQLTPGARNIFLNYYNAEDYQEQRGAITARKAGII